MRGRIVVGLVALVAGIAWILDLQGFPIFPGGIGTWWPSLLIVLGLARLVSHPRWWGGPVFMIGLGVILQAWTLHLIPDPWWAYVAPFALIVFGLWFLMRPSWRSRWEHHGEWRRSWRHEARERGWEGQPIEREDTVVFANADREAPASEYKGGELTAVFGQLRADLRRAKLPESGARLKATSVFGGLDIRVPPEWRVEVHGTPVFGKVENRTTSAPATGPTLDIEAVSVFGDVRVTN